MSKIRSEPFALDFDPKTTALVIIDMQRDFVLQGGIFGWVSDSENFIEAIA